MAGSTRSCCVPRCNTTYIDSITLHSFPHPEREKERFILWVNVVGSSLTSLDHNFIHKNRKICHNHFEERYLTWTKRLSPDAVPTLHMPGDLMNGFFKSTAQQQRQAYIFLHHLHPCEFVKIESIPAKKSSKRKREDKTPAVKGCGPIVFADV